MEIEDTSLATIDGKFATGKVLGKTSVILRDRNVPKERGDDQPNASCPRASLSVTEAAKMSVNLLPHYNWATVEGEKHDIAIELYTR